MVFLKDDYLNLNVKILKHMCKLKKIKNFSHLKKEDLFTLYNKFLASQLIIKAYRQHLYKNAIDHITLEQVGYPCFIYKTKNNKLFFYSYDSIIKNIIKSGNVRDPMTRVEYTDEELTRLDNNAKYYYPEIKYKSTLRIKKDPSYARRIRNRENEITSFHMRLNELKNNILIAVESRLLSWNIIGPFVVDLIEYSSINSYIKSMIYELQIVLLNLKNHEPDNARIFKQELLEEIDTDNEIYRLISQINV